MKEREKKEKDAKGGSAWLGPDHEDCPVECCGQLDDECQRHMAEYGYNVDVDEEIMLVFGGLTQRKRTFTSSEGEDYEVYNYCEKY